MEIHCYKCDAELNYKGQARGKQYLTCAKCHYKIRFDKAFEKKHGRIPKPKINISPEKSEENEFKIIKNKEGDQLLQFPDNTQVIIPRGEILQRMIKIPEHGEKPETQKEQTISYSKYFCDKHKIPLTYDSDRKEWVCHECEDPPLPPGFNVVEGNSIIREIPLPEVRIVPFNQIQNILR